MPSDVSGTTPLPPVLQAYLDQTMQVAGHPMEDSPVPDTEIRATASAARIPRMGILGGTFDPIHIGHLLLAQEAASCMQLDRVYFVPAGQPPHKPGQPIVPIPHRLAMVEMATGDNALFAVSRLDADEQAPSYTVDLIKRMRARLQIPVQIYFLMGMDSLQDLATWHQPDWLIDHCHLVALSRPAVQVNWSALERRFANIRCRVTVLDMPGLDVSGMNVRERLRSRHPIRYLVPPAVIHYIQTHGLYAPPRTAKQEPGYPPLPTNCGTC